MNRSIRMLLMSGGRTSRTDRGDRDRESMRYGYGERDSARMGDYDPEYRFRDRRGREHYDDGRYAPMSTYGGGYGDMYYPYEPYVPPVYERGDYHGRDWRESPVMHRIGFAVEGEMERMPRESDRQYRQSRDYRDQSGMHDRNRREDEPMQFSREIAMEWTGDMQNGDGSRGPHWSMEQVKQVMEQRGIECDPLQFFAVLNSVYSDYCSVAKKHGVNKMDFYADLAKAWLEDPDAAEDKAARYFEYIVKH